MRGIIISCLLLLSWYSSPCACGVLIQPNEVDTLLENQRLLNNMVKCLLDEGPCTKQGKDIKKNLPSALQSSCENCDEQQKRSTEKMFKTLKAKFPAEWGKLLKKFDPDGGLRTKNQWLSQFV